VSNAHHTAHPPFVIQKANTKQPLKFLHQEQNQVPNFAEWFGLKGSSIQWTAWIWSCSLF